MENPLTVDLAEMTEDGRVTNLSGRPRGLAARQKYGLEWHSLSDARKVVIQVPYSVDSLTPSFFQGMFGAAFSALEKKRDRFLDFFVFDAPPLIKSQIEQGMSALEISRDLADLH